MSFNNFIPVAWSTKLQKDIERVTVFAENCNREYEGLVKEAGDSVKILGIGSVNLTGATDGKLPDAPTLQEVEDVSATMPVNQIQTFNFGVGDLDKAQAKPSGGLEAYMTDARDRIAQAQDKHIAGIHVFDENVYQLDAKSATLVDTSSTDSQILNVVDAGLGRLLEHDVSRNTEITLTAPPWFIMLMKRKYVDLDTNNSEMMKNGRVGRYGGITLKESNNVYTSVSGSDTLYHIQLKTNRAIAFVAPFMHMEPYRPESKYFDAVKGWTLYQAKTVRPKEIIDIIVKKPTETGISWS